MTERELLVVLAVIVAIVVAALIVLSRDRDRRGDLPRRRP